MEATFVPVCFHPTSVVLIDDEPRFLEATAIKIGKYMAVKNFNDPTEALKFLIEDYKFEPFTKKCLVRTEDEKYDHRSIDVNIQLILQELYNPNVLSKFQWL